MFGSTKAAILTAGRNMHSDFSALENHATFRGKHFADRVMATNADTSTKLDSNNVS